MSTGLAAIIGQSHLFDYMPDGAYDAFSALNEVQTMDGALELVVSWEFG